MLHAIKNFFRRLFGRPVSRKRKRTIVLLWTLLLAAPLFAHPLSFTLQINPITEELHHVQ